MFTGLIERVGVVARAARKGGGVELFIETGAEPFEVGEGDSVAVDGVCLTATSVSGAGFSVDVSRESLDRSTLGAAKAGGKVNLERALRLGDRLGGHLVTGHVDAVGRISETRPESGFTRITIAAPPEVINLTVEKGSIAVDGISLTVNAVSADSFQLTIIPETIERTTLAAKRPGDQVNLETDLIGKYVAKLIGKDPSTKDSDIMKKLMEEGFIS